MRLAEKVAIITGGGRGIGRATALAFVKTGARVVLAATTEAEIEGVANEVRELGGEAVAVATDVTSKNQVVALVDKTLEAFGQVDILVNNAGVAIHNPIAAIREEDWDLNIAVNLKGVFLCTQAVFQHMCDRGTGHIMNGGRVLCCHILRARVTFAGATTGSVEAERATSTFIRSDMICAGARTPDRTRAAALDGHSQT